MSKVCFIINGIESQHFKEKNEQSFRKSDVEEVIETIKVMIERQQDDEIRALYSSGPYRLADAYKHFEKDSVKWHSLSQEQRLKHVKKFHACHPTPEKLYQKPKMSGRKPSDRKRNRKPEPEVYIENGLPKTAKIDHSLRINDPNEQNKPFYHLYLRFLVPRLVQVCQGKCGRRLVTADENDYLLIKSFGPSTFMRKGETVTEYGSQYIHFKSDCLKEYARLKHGVTYENFPFEIIEVNVETLKQLSETKKQPYVYME